MTSDDNRLTIIRYWCKEARILVRKNSGEFYMKLEYNSAMCGDYVIRITRDCRQLSDAVDSAYRMVVANAWEACK